MKMNKSQTIFRAITWRMPILGALLASTSFSVLLGTRDAQGAISCLLGENVDMMNPVVTVIEGPGDAAAEQAQWSALEYAGLGGPLELGLGERTFELEAAP